MPTETEAVEEVQTPPVPPHVTALERIKVAADEMNKQVSADVHARMHAQQAVLNAIVDLIKTGG